MSPDLAFAHVDDAAVRVRGGLEEEVHVRLDEEQLRRTGLSVQSVIDRLRQRPVPTRPFGEAAELLFGCLALGEGAGSREESRGCLKEIVP